MRILYVIDGFGVGGAEMLLLDLLDEARRRGAATHVAYFSPGPLADEVARRAGGVTRLSRHRLRDPRALWRAIRLMRAFRPDVVHTHLTKSDLVGQLAARIAGVRSRIITFHNTDAWRRRRLPTLIYRLLTAGATRRIAVSSEVARHIAQTGTAPLHRIEVIANGVDTDRFDPARQAAFPGMAQPAQALRIAIIGRLTAQKDHENFLAAAAPLAQARPQVHLYVVGDGELRGALEDRARALRLLPDRLTFTGILRDMPSVLAASDVVVLSSAWEGLPIILLEAMAMARAIVATAVGEIPALLGSGAGIVVPPADPSALSAAMQKLVDDPDLRARLGKAARDRAVQGYSNRTMLARTFDLYGAAG